MQRELNPISISSWPLAQEPTRKDSCTQSSIAHTRIRSIMIGTVRVLLGICKLAPISQTSISKHKHSSEHKLFICEIDRHKDMQQVIHQPRHDNPIINPSIYSQIKSNTQHSPNRRLTQSLHS